MNSLHLHAENDQPDYVVCHQRTIDEFCLCERDENSSLSHLEQNDKGGSDIALEDESSKASFIKKYVFFIFSEG